MCGAMRNTSRPDITKRTFPEPKNFFAARHLASFPAFRGERFLGLTVISRASRRHRQIRARGMSDGEESCAVCSRSIGGPKAETLTAECCRRRFHDLCIARHCATRRDEVPSRRTRRVFGGVVVHAPKRATNDRPTRPSTSRWPIHLSISASSTTHRRSPAPRAPPLCGSSRRTPWSPAHQTRIKGASNAEDLYGKSPCRNREIATLRPRRARVSSTFPARACD